MGLFGELLHLSFISRVALTVLFVLPMRYSIPSPSAFWSGRRYLYWKYKNQNKTMASQFEEFRVNIFLYVFSFIDKKHPSVRWSLFRGGKPRKQQQRLHPRQSCQSLSLYNMSWEEAYFYAIGKMSWENQNTSRADVVQGVAERDWAVVQDTREATTVIRVTKHNYSSDPVLNIWGDPFCSEM